MKEQYEKLKMEAVEFEEADVITGSNTTDEIPLGGNTNPDPNPQ